MDRSLDRNLQRQLEEDPVLEQATDWFVELQGSDVPLERVAEWQRWLMSNERHRTAYQSIESLWGAVDKVDSQVWPGPEEITSDRYDPETTVSAWRARRSGSAVRVRYALAASVMVGVALAASQISAVRNLFSPSAVAVETQTGERREIRLSDGSIITVGGRSSVSATFTPKARELKLNSGEAFFDVAKDPGRPFVVHAGATAVTALGTQFNVRRMTDQVVVAVAEGLVQVDVSETAASTREMTGALSSLPGKKAERAAMRLVAGEQLSVASTGAINARQTVDAGAVGGWRAGKLRYLDEPLAVVVADVRRYAERDIEIADPAIGEFRITGTVFENDVESWLRTLERAFPIQSTTDASGKIVLDSPSGARDSGK